MADLQKGDAAWLRFSREESWFLRLARSIEDQRRRAKRERVQIVNWNDFNANFTSATLSGVEFGSNTTEDGRLYVRVVANGGNWDVNLYTAAGASGLVGTVTDVAASATGTIVAQNSSGLSGTVTMAASVTAEIDDVHQWILLIDWKLEHLKLWPSDGTTNEDALSRQAAQRVLTRLDGLYLQALDIVRTGLAEWALAAPDNPVARGNKFLEAADTSLLTETSSQDSSGNVTRRRTGFWQTQLENQRDEATGSEQDIIQRVIAAAAGSFDSNNDGQGAVAATTPEGHCPVGRWTFQCVSGLGNDRGGTEEFDGSFQSTVGGDDTTFTFRQLRVKQSWKGPRGFGPITLNRTHTKTGDAANLNLGVAGAPGTTTFSTDGETENNTGSGVLWWVVAANGSNWNFSFYSSVNKATGDLVAKVENVATAATSVQATARNGSILSITFDVGSGPVDTTTGTLDLNFFSIDNGSSGSAATPDKFSVSTSLTSEGKASRILAEIFGGYMNPDVSGSEQLDDDMLAQANTFVPYIKTDI